VLAVAIPVIFIHVQYQPGFGVAFGSTTVNAYLSDFAVLAVVVAALVSGVRNGFEPLARGRVLWLLGILFFVWVAFEVWHGHSHASSYAWHKHGVTAAKFAEYALLAPAVPLIIRRARDLHVVLWSFALWSCAATVIGVAQFFGANIFLVGTFLRRQASFLSEPDFSALSVVATLTAIVVFSLPSARLPRLLGRVAATGGVIGMIVSGAIASLLGLATALLVGAQLLWRRRELDRRRILIPALLGLTVAVGSVALRGKDIDQFARFVGATPAKAQQQAKIQTYAHRTLLSWLGYKIWREQPLLGVGWEGSQEPANFLPLIPEAHRRFPNEAPLAFPTAAANRRYGVQDAWIQTLADLGVVGFLLWLSMFVSGAWLAARRAIPTGDAPSSLALLLIAALLWLWAAQGLVAGIPLDAITWIVLGLATVRGLPE
jgi:O-antigen ligase